jgi:uncharacterized protein (TIGR02328 family)
MRLWHQDLIPLLDRQRLLGQHREICALYGLGFGKKHATVNYVFNYPLEALYAYHILIINEMNKRGYKVSEEWNYPNYRGKRCEPYQANTRLIQHYLSQNKVYFEHDGNYLKECIENLKGKGIEINI